MLEWSYTALKGLHPSERERNSVTQSKEKQGDHKKGSVEFDAFDGNASSNSGTLPKFEHCQSYNYSASTAKV